MLPSKPWMSTTFRVGKRTVTLAMERPERGDYGMELEHVEWRPSMPKRLTKKEWRQYRAGRDAMVAEAARLAGMTIGLMEFDVFIARDAQ